MQVVLRESSMTFLQKLLWQIWTGSKVMETSTSEPSVNSKQESKLGSTKSSARETILEPITGTYSPLIQLGLSDGDEDEEEERDFLVIWVHLDEDFYMDPYFEKMSVEDEEELPELNEEVDGWQVVSVSIWKPKYEILLEKNS
jgi:hypothetical protein